ncbi:hypothetical protein [Fischerella thermalis]|uniref:hypothetical protein n=1 Tax=Fischerella thermalis TaxID=372787 RepID=UPI00307DEF27
MLRCRSLIFPITLWVRYFAISASAKTASSLTDYPLPITSPRDSISISANMILNIKLLSLI